MSSPARSTLLSLSVLILLIAQFSWPYLSPNPSHSPPSTLVQHTFAASLAKCAELHERPGVPIDFHNRTQSDRWDGESPDVLIKNATIWTGEDDGKEVRMGEVWIRNGLVSHVAGRGEPLPSKLSSSTIQIDAHGLFDLHSHLGAESFPLLSATIDENSVLPNSNISPYLRSLDGFNGHDESFKLSVAGGTTSAIVLPGSANQMGGQAFAFKLRPTKDNSPRSRLLEPPFDIAGLNRTRKAGEPLRWRSMKMACGENPRRVYGMNRMDEGWATRSSFEKATKLKVSQDEFCDRAIRASNAKTVLAEKFPDDLEWEALVALLRGKVKLHTHCYTTEDLDSFTRHSNEWKYEVAAFHHAHEAHLVPDIIKSAWNSTPAAAIFAVFAGYKKEAYYSSVFAAKLLHESGIKVVLKSDGPSAVFPRHLIFEAAQVHYYGLPAHVAMSSVTSTPATVAGLGHRVGFVRPGYDADIVLWNSHPLSLGATPQQVLVDGIPQLPLRPITGPIFPSSLLPPTPPHHTKASIAASISPDLPTSRNVSSSATFINISEIFLPGNVGDGGIDHLSSTPSKEDSLSLVVRDGKIICAGHCPLSPEDLQYSTDLKGGTILPPLISFGPPMGLEVFESEPSTSDGMIPGNSLRDLKEVLNGGVARAADGVSFGDKHVLLAKEAGVGIAVASPPSGGFLKGLAVAFRTAAKHGLEQDAFVKEVVGLHLSIARSSSGTPSITTQINALRQLLLSPPTVTGANYFDLAANGALPLIISVNKADDIAALIRLKVQVELERGSQVKLVIAGGAEAWIVADELAAHDVAVILSPLRAPPSTWSSLRANPGPPLTPATSLTILHRAGVKLGISVHDAWLASARQLLLEMGWALKSSDGELSRGEVVSLATTSLASVLGLDHWQMGAAGERKAEFLAYEGDALSGFEAKLVASASPVGAGGVEFFL
ncbi:hypothetical protein RQP46_009508 [Phenoliferia psychrophenolica]